MSLRDVATKLNENHQLIDKIEKGERNLSVLEYVQFCDVLGISAEEGLKILRNEKPPKQVEGIDKLPSEST